MRIYLDQMIRCEVAEQLATNGFSVLRAEDVDQSRADDRKILDFAIKTERLLITLDEHFGDWILLPLSRHPGVIRLKIHPTTTEKISVLLIPFLKKDHHLPFRNHLIILSETNERWIKTA